MLLCCLSLTLLRAQEGVRFESLTFKEALQKAKEENPNITTNQLNQLRKELYPNGSKNLLEKEFGKI